MAIKKSPLTKASAKLKPKLKKKTKPKIKPTSPLKKKPIVKAKKATAPVATISMQQVKEVIGLIKDAGYFNTFSYKTPEFEIEIEVGNKRSPEVSSSVNLVGVPQTTTPQAAVVSKPRGQAGHFEVLSPMVGTFYRRPNPTSPPFVEIGSKVSADTPVCIVEVMKLLNTIAAERAGKIIDICVADGATIEAGQVLMVIEL